MKVFGSAAPVLFAEKELKRILAAMTDADVSGLQIGCFDAFPEIEPKRTARDALDDEIYISVRNFSGIIAGCNPRSVLIAAYRYAKELGARFVNVGKAGEILPKLTETEHSVFVHEIPSYRHRGVCIEGAVSTENVIEMVDFLPKVGMNTYFIQFREAHTFFERWYGHRNNPLKAHPEFTREDAQACVREVEKEMSERGILYQAVGHGWTCEPFGVPGLGWEPWTEEIAPEVLENFALVNGVRGLAEGITLNTHACYSNPKVRKAIIDDVCNYIKDHPTLDVLHFWLADGVNGVCECDGCKVMRPSDMYITLLNDLDAALTAQGSDAKIVFLLYLDLLWPPMEQTLNNPDRFILMFAPISRSYNTSFGVSGELPEMAPFVYNKVELPKDPNQNVSYLRAWQKVFSGDSFIYDYHYMWAFMYDPGSIKLARVLSEDIRNLKDLGLDGFISCQIGRVMFPNGFNMVTMGEMLWNRDASFDLIAKDYFDALYGEAGSDVLAYLSELSKRFAPLDLQNEKDFAPDAEKAAVAEEIYHFISKQDFSDRALAAHAEYCMRFAKFLANRYAGKPADVETLKQYVWEIEDEFQGIYDAWSYDNVLRHIWKLYE
ncbi:MAG: DUF4838 domain-containing protein [Oscillospiraceae bacterium]|nr:DUF4838 domain-containing protein [Oscillospiraceae bacterium]